jgi:hypothetical protein
LFSLVTVWGSQCPHRRWPSPGIRHWYQKLELSSTRPSSTPDGFFRIESWEALGGPPEMGHGRAEDSVI